MDTELRFGHREWMLAYRVALKVLKVPDQAEDAAQETLLNAYAARASFAGRSKPESWLYRIAHNTAVTHLRRPFARRYSGTDVFVTLETSSRDTPSQSPEDDVIASQLAGCLTDCLDHMRPKDRLAFTERFLLGTTERELGELLGVSTNAAKQRAFRARRTVRSLIADRGLTR